MMLYITKKRLSDEDWKTQLALGYSDIPKGAIVVFKKVISNFYGTYANVLYNGRIYSVKFKDIEPIE